MIAVIDAPTFEAWSRTFHGRADPFEYAGRQWLCTWTSSGPCDRFGYLPPEQLGAGVVVPEEEWPEASFSCGAPGTRGRRARIGHATKGRPFVYTGERLLASTNCGKPTWSSPGGAIHEPFEIDGP